MERCSATKPLKKMKEDSNINNKKKNKPNSKTPLPSIYWLYGAIFVALLGFNLFYGNVSTPKKIENSELKTMIAQREIQKVIFVKKDERSEIYLKDSILNSNPKYKEIKDKNPKGPHFFITTPDYATFKNELKAEIQKNVDDKTWFIKEDSNLSVIEQRALTKQIEADYQINEETDNSRNWGGDIFWWLFPILFIVLIFVMMSRTMGRGMGGGGIFSIGKSKAQLFDKDKQMNVTFKDVAGLEGAKEEIVEIVDFLKNPEKYTKLGGKIPKGCLLVGPPGTGKTLLAKAVAGEAKVPFFSLSGSDFVEMFVGVGASRVRDLFRNAKEKAPCIIFIDEIDAIGRARGRNLATGGNDERENTLNQLLTEMDGFSTNNGVIILAATNRADILDRALLRAGRFDRQIHVELPNIEERRAIFNVHVTNLKLAKELDLDFLAKNTPGFSGADIANVCNEAALIAARNSKKAIDKDDFLAAIDRIIGGLERRGKIITPEEKKVIAYHEAGHAAVSWLLEHASPLLKVTIVPRGKSLGAAWYLPEERQITTTEQFLDEITATLGGRAAEEVVFGQISTGALNDLERVTKQAYAMVAYYGLNKNIGNLSYYDSTGQSDYSFAKPFSEKTAEAIDREIHNLIETSYNQAKKILTDNREKLTQLAEMLLNKEVIFSDNLEQIFGKRPFEKKSEVPLQ